MIGVLLEPVVEETGIHTFGTEDLGLMRAECGRHLGRVHHDLSVAALYRADAARSTRSNLEDQPCVLLPNCGGNWVSAYFTPLRLRRSLSHRS